MVEHLSDFMAAVKDVPLDRFTSLFPHPFLVQRGGEEDADGASQFGTVIMRPGATPGVGLISDPKKCRVYRVEKRKGASFQEMITIGRAPNNDIPILDPLISKFHAHIEMEGAESCTITDAGSTNGTLINGQEIDMDEKRELQDGDRISFGGDHLYIYLTAEAFYHFIALRLKHISQ